MKRSSVSLEDIADWANLTQAANRAALGKRDRVEVREFFADLHGNLSLLRRGILADTVNVGHARSFAIRDPKPRVIHAPCFRERALHHAVMNRIGPVLERSLVDDTYACRVGRGALAAVSRCHQHVQRFQWWAKLDIRQYFASIDHRVVLKQLSRKFKSEELLAFLYRIIDAYGEDRRGLPIGALTSQCLANFYLGPLDRFLSEQRQVCGMVRYMDDFIFWGNSRREVSATDAACRAFLRNELKLEAKPNRQINRSSGGVTLCGFRVFPGTIRLAQSRMRRFRHGKRKWERRWLAGEISSRELQRGYDAVHAITLHADADQWRRQLAMDSPEWHDDV